MRLGSTRPPAAGWWPASRRLARFGHPVVATAVAVVLAVVAGLTIGPARGRHAANARRDLRATDAAVAPRMAMLRAALTVPAADDARQIAVAAAAEQPAPLFRPMATPHPLRILVVGDSVGVTFARGLKIWAAHHDAQVLDASREWCALGRGLPISHGMGIQTPGTGCDGWAPRWANDVAHFDPDVVLVYFTIWEAAPRQLPDRADPQQPGTALLDTWQLSEYQTAADVLSARGAAVDWFTVPCENEPIVAGSPLWVVNRQTIPALAASRAAVHVIDLDHELCARGPSRDYAGVRDARPDGAHLSDAGALAVANWVMPIVRGETENPPTAGEAEPPALPIAFTRTAG